MVQTSREWGLCHVEYVLGGWYTLWWSIVGYSSSSTFIGYLICKNFAGGVMMGNVFLPIGICWYQFQVVGGPGKGNIFSVIELKKTVNPIFAAGDLARELAAVVFDRVEDIAIHRHRQTGVRFVRGVKFDMNLAIRNRVRRMLSIFGRFSARNLMGIVRVCRGYRQMWNGCRNMEFQVSEVLFCFAVTIVKLLVKSRKVLLKYRV